MMAITDGKGMITIYETKPDREFLQCKFDIIVLPESIFDSSFVKSLKAKQGPFNIEEYGTDHKIP